NKYVFAFWSSFANKSASKLTVSKTCLKKCSLFFMVFSFLGFYDKTQKTDRYCIDCNNLDKFNSPCHFSFSGRSGDFLNIKTKSFQISINYAFASISYPDSVWL